MDLSALHELSRKTQTSDQPIINYIMGKFIAPKMTAAQTKLVAETMKHRCTQYNAIRDVSEINLL